RRGATTPRLPSAARYSANPVRCRYSRYASASAAVVKPRHVLAIIFQNLPSGPHALTPARALVQLADQPDLPRVIRVVRDDAEQGLAPRRAARPLLQRRIIELPRTRHQRLVRLS